MSGPTVASLDLRAIEAVLEMSGGYVLDFVDRTFAEFFQDHGINIDEQRFFANGTSKANRLRCFLKTSDAPLAGRVLAALLEHRLLSKPEGLVPADLDRYRKTVARLESTPSSDSERTPAKTHEDAEAMLLRHVFRPEPFTKLSLDSAMSQALIERMQEAQRCIGVQANLSAVILCGSVLEGMCLGFGSLQPERVNRAYAAVFNRSPRQFHDWKLSEWIDVLESLGDLSPNVGKFGHALRAFRNYVHPAEQLANEFTPDQRTARISFQVVVAAAEDLAQASVPSK